jgi:two-component system chemotaxis response regulator CheB
MIEWEHVFIRAMRHGPPFWASVCGNTTKLERYVEDCFYWRICGCTNALAVILASLPEDSPAAILIVTHIGAHKSLLPDILQRITSLQVRHATDGELIIPGRVLVAPSDEHLTVVASGNQIYTRLAHGPRENNCRPAIDPLFRSAAVACGPGTIGVVLSGYLNDGTVGVQAIKVRGGMAIVQDPADAEVREMPASAIDHAPVDLALSVRQIGPALVQLASRDLAPRQTTGQDWIDIENRLTVRESDMEISKKSASPLPLPAPSAVALYGKLSFPGQSAIAAIPHMRSQPGCLNRCKPPW